jgi:hypothetical protein
VGALVRHRLVIRHILLALPPVAATLGLAIVACAELAGSDPLTMGAPRSVSEAIAMRDPAGAARLVESGADVNAIELIRAGVLFDRPLLATPSETAVIVDQAPMLEFLASRGAAVPRDRLTCLATDLGARSVRPQLGDASSCRPGAAWAAVLARP